MTLARDPVRPGTAVDDRADTVPMRSSPRPAETPAPDPGPAPAPSPAPPPGPSRASRLVGIDAARGLALVGMMAVHVLANNDDAGRETWVSIVFGGTASALFAVLAGVGIAFTTGRTRVPWRTPHGDAVGTRGLRSVAPALLARALAVGAVGLALGVVDSDDIEVILGYYAVLFAMAIPLVTLGRRTLGAVGALLLVAAPVVSQLLRPHLPPPSGDNPTLGALLTHPLDLLSDLAFTGFYPAVAWLPYLCVGLVVGRLRLSDRSVAAAMVVVGVALSVTTAVLAEILLGARGGLAQIVAATPGLPPPPELAATLTEYVEGTTPTTTWWWLAVPVPHSGTPFDLARTIGTSLAAIGVMLLLGQLALGGASPVARGVRALLALLGAAGSMTLTFYVLHVAFVTSPFDTYTPGTGFTIQVIAVLLLGLAWRTTAGRGPLESAVSALAARAGRLGRRGPTPSA